jgi:molybdopterin converting factor small subunit
VIRVLFFSVARTVTGIPEVRLPHAEAPDVPRLWELLLARFPGLGPRRESIRLARNGEFVGPEARFEPGDDIALIPPVSGG